MEEFKKMIDPSVKPGEDFYQYANGTWLKNNPIPPQEAKWGSFYILREENLQRLKDIVEELLNQEYPKGSDEQIIKDLYLSALDPDKAKQTGMTVLKNIFDEIDQINDKDSFIKMLAKMNLWQLSSVWGFYVHADDKKSDQNIFYIEQGGLGLPDRDYYFGEDPNMNMIREKYGQHVAKVFETLPDKIENPLLSVLKIERELAGASMTMVERRDVEALYNKFDLAKIKEHAPNINWQLYFETIGANPSEFIVHQPNFVKKFSEMLDGITWEEWRIYLKWHTALSLSSFLGEEFEQLQFDFYGKVIVGLQEIKPRWKRILGVIENSVGEGLGKLFVKKHFPPKAEQRMRELVEDIRSAFSERINNLEWMDKSTKEYAQIKLAKVKVKVGHPEKWRDYSTLDINPESYAQNGIKAAIFESQRNIKKLGEPVDREEWLMTPQQVNAYAMYTTNEITFPAGILQPPFFDFKADDAINYGGIGVVIAHELTHGFDDKGSKYDADGNMRDWRTEQDMKNFEQRAEMVIEQANQYKVFPDITLNGKLTLGENIADLGGVEIAFHALKKAWARNGKSDPIEGFTAEQRFFLSYARTEAANARDEVLRLKVISDPHSPSPFRVNFPLANCDEFYSAFKITESDPLYRPMEQRAKIW